VIDGRDGGLPAAPAWRTGGAMPHKGPPGVARHDDAAGGAIVASLQGAFAGELARVLRRDPLGATPLARTRAGRLDQRDADQELAVRSRDRLRRVMFQMLIEGPSPRIRAFEYFLPDRRFAAPSSAAARRGWPYASSCRRLVRISGSFGWRAAAFTAR